jgi:hypothetical protein
MLDSRGRVAEQRERFHHRGVDVNPAAARGDAHDLLRDRFTRGMLAERRDRVGAHIHREDPEIIFRLKDIQGEHRALIGERHLRLALHLRGHRAGTIKHNQKSDARHILAIFMFHPHRQQLFDR